MIRLWSWFAVAPDRFDHRNGGSSGVSIMAGFGSFYKPEALEKEVVFGKFNSGLQF